MTINQRRRRSLARRGRDQWTIGVGGQRAQAAIRDLLMARSYNAWRLQVGGQANAVRLARAPYGRGWMLVLRPIKVRKGGAV